MKIPCARLIPACFLLALPGAALSAEISVDATSIVRFEQRDDKVSQNKTLSRPRNSWAWMPTNWVTATSRCISMAGGAADLADKSYNNDQVDGNLTYGYLQYRFKAANADIRAGRFFVHEGIVNEQIDGVSFRTDLPFGFGFSAFGGANVHTQICIMKDTDGKGDANFGGRLNYRYKGVLELGVSGQYETDAPLIARSDDPLLATYEATIALVGGDVWFSPHRMRRAHGAHQLQHGHQRGGGA